MNTTRQTRRHAFVDESKAKDYLLVAVFLDTASRHRTRGVVRSLILPGQTRLHMRKESDTRRRIILRRQDRQRIVETLHRTGSSTLDHRHERAAVEPLLALPDAIGWAWAKGGDWRRRCGPVTVENV